MKLGNKILELRKQKGLSQEQLGEKLDVTRQTISNWELGETSPNTDQLKALSKEFQISIDELLDNDIQNILVEKVSNTEKLAGLILKIIKIVLIVVPLMFILLITVSIIFRATRNSSSRIIEENIYCQIYGEEHSYSVSYEELTGRPVGQGGDSYFDDILNLVQYDNAHQIFNVINDYVKKNGGTCEMIIDRDLSDIVSIEIQNLTNTSMKIIIHDSNPKRIIYGEDFYIEKYANKNNSWEEIETIHDDYLFNAMAYYVDENGILEMNINWEYMYGSLPKGTYRIVKDVYYESDIPVDEHDKYIIWQEFEIE